MRRSFLAIRAGVLVGAGLVLASNLSWESPVRAAMSPFSDAAVLSVPVQEPRDPTVMRSRLVALDVDTLPDPRRRSQLAREPGLSLELFPDVFVEAVFDRFDPNQTGVTWVGRLAGEPRSAVTLVYGGGLLAGTVATSRGLFQIRPASEAVRRANPQAFGDVHVIAQVDQSAFLREADPLEVTLSPEAVSAAGDVVMADTAGVIDVMVVYTSAAQLHAGGTAAITNLINLSISETNTSYANSDILQRVRLVHTAPVTYTEVSAFGTNLSNLRFGSGSGLGGVAALRNQYGADLVAMLVHPASPSACGVAYVMTTVSTAFETAGFSVTDTACLSPNYTFAHELGHNMGAQHDWYVSQATLPYTYAHGYVNPAVGYRWRTIMAYNDRCTVQGFSCSRLLAWSNPENRLSPVCASGNFICRANLWLVPGTPVPFGVPGGTKSPCSVGNLADTECDADNRRALNNTALTVANFRQSVSNTASRIR